MPGRLPWNRKSGSLTIIVQGIEDNALQYAGHTAWSRHNEKTKSGYVGGKKLRSKDQWAIQRDTHEAVISDEQAESISRPRAENGRKQLR